MEKYEFSIRYIENWNIEKTINTEIIIEEQQMEVTGEEVKRIMPEKVHHRHPKGKYSKPFNPFFTGKRKIIIGNILSIKIKNGRVFGLFTIGCYILYIIGIIAIFYKMFISAENSSDLVSAFAGIPALVIVSYLWFMLCDFEEIYKYKALKINIKNEDPICIPIENWKDNKEVLMSFIDNLQKGNPKIKLKESINRNKKIKILVFLISIAISFTIIVYL